MRSQSKILKYIVDAGSLTQKKRKKKKRGGGREKNPQLIHNTFLLQLKWLIVREQLSDKDPGPSPVWVQWKISSCILKHNSPLVSELLMCSGVTHNLHYC